MYLKVPQTPALLQYLLVRVGLKSIYKCTDDIDTFSGGKLGIFRLKGEKKRSVLWYEIRAAAAPQQERLVDNL